MDAKPQFSEVQDPFDAYEPPRKPRGCVFYGCLISIILSVILAVVIGVGLLLTWRAVNDLVKEYAEDSARLLPVATLPDAELKDVQDRMLAFQESLEAGRKTEPLILTSNQINALIASNPELKGVVAVDLQKDKIRGEVSLPLDPFGFKGKFLNGAAVFDVRMDNGLLLATIDELEVKGNPVPEAVMAKLRMENLAREANSDEKGGKAIRRIEKIEVKDGKLIITPRPPGPVEGPETPEAKNEVGAPETSKADEKAPPAVDPPK